MSLPTFVVGTGRCGSTMLSNMFREHPSILSISEFFPFAVDIGGRIRETFPIDKIDGKGLWEIIGKTKPRASLMVKHDVAFSELIYPFKSSRARFSGETGIPMLLNATLPHITEEHDRLFDEIEKEVIDLPPASIGEHYINLFNLLQKKFNKKVWIERSGGIFVLSELIFATFADARFIHIVRDGRNTALSMSHHLGFRMFLLGDILTKYLGVDPYESQDRSNIDRLPLKFHKFLPENFDRQAFLDYQFPLSVWGELWSQQIIDGLNHLSKVPQDRLLTIVYEDILANPQAVLHELMAFLGAEFIDSNWIEKASATIRQPRSSWQNLPDRDRIKLTKACQPGFEALSNAGIKIAKDLDSLPI